jgi:hypothetical protein
MSDDSPRRVKNQPPEAPTGYRSTRRGSKAAKAAKAAKRQHEVVTSIDRVGRAIRNIGYVIAMGVGALLVVVLALLLVASAVNFVARWNAKQHSQKTGLTETDRRIKENVLIIGDQGGKAVGFLAVRVTGADKQVYGIAIPDGAFIEVPGQGFERLGDSYSAGPQVSLAAISNYLTVQFRAYVVVPAAVYQEAVKSQSLANVLDRATKTNLTAEDKNLLGANIAAIPSANVAIVPLPVKPVHLGAQTYFEPQKAQVADLLTKWWGVDPTKASQVTRVILYNGAGKPGIAGEAALPLIRVGLRVVDTKNADNFNYAKTLIIVQHGSVEQGNEIAKVLGVGQVKSQPSDQNIADVIVIIGKDYEPQSAGSTGGKKK